MAPTVRAGQATRPSHDVRPGSGSPGDRRPGRVHDGPAASPRPRRLELGGKEEERGLVAEAAEEVHADRQAVVVPPERYGHRRAGGEVGEDTRHAPGRAAGL